MDSTPSAQYYSKNEDGAYDLCTWCKDGCEKGRLFCEDCEISGVPELIQKVEDLTEENKRLKSQIEMFHHPVNSSSSSGKLHSDIE